ncbi:MAG: MMPL family transporter [Magnetospirillum sp.]|nr:MMPL family transporter [Magnetospirillum sp.]
MRGNSITGGTSMAARVVTWCWRHGGWVVAVVLLLLLPAGWLAATGLSLDSDETHMLSADLPFRQAEQRFDAAFPQYRELLLLVVDGDSAEQAEVSADALVARLAGDQRFLSVERPATEAFFRDHALLFLPPRELEEVADRLIQAQPLLGGLAADPSARGLLAVLSLMAEGVRLGQVPREQVAPVLDMVAETGRTVLAGRPRPLSLLGLVSGREGSDTRRLVLARPRLDHTSLVPGEAAAQAVRAAAEGLPARVRLTGPVALSDDNFRTVAEGVAPTLLLSLALVTALLLAAVGSLRVTAAILVTLAVGLVFTSAFAALAVGVLNPLSVAFVVLFLGLAVDFGIQFAVRFRDDHHRLGDATRAMQVTAAKVARPLTVVAVAIALGFLSFLPTDYVGVSQLGLIAAGGMLVGIALTLTLLPALLGLLRPPPARKPAGFTALEPVEQVLRTGPKVVVGAAVALGVAAAAVALTLRFDFDPLHLQNPRAESVGAFRDLAADPASSPYGIEITVADPSAADALARRLEGKPEIAFALTLSSLVPDHQGEKLAVIADLDHLLGPTLNPPETMPAPTATELSTSLDEAARAWESAGFTQPALVLRQVLARGRVEAFAEAVAGGVPPLLTQLRRLLASEPVTADSLPPRLVRDWVGQGGEGRVSVQPARPLSSPAEMHRFVAAVRAVEPMVSGAPVAIVDSGQVAVAAFAQAGAAALAAAVLLLSMVMRRPVETVLVLAPLLLGVLLALAALALSGVAINFANIIAFPLLLGIGVAFNVYFVMGWRKDVALLSSATARAVLFSALTTGVSFGALALSSHRGTASLGLVLMVGLALMVLASALFLPAVFALVERRRSPRP